MAGLADFSRSRGLAVVWAAGSVIGDGVGQMLQTSATAALLCQLLKATEQKFISSQVNSVQFSRLYWRDRIQYGQSINKHNTSNDLMKKYMGWHK